MVSIFRKLWAIVLVLSIFWMCSGFLMVRESAQTADIELGSQETEGASDLGIAVGSTVMLSFFFCTGIPALFISAFLFWRNGVRITEDRRHDEMMTGNLDALPRNQR